MNIIVLLSTVIFLALFVWAELKSSKADCQLKKTLRELKKTERDLKEGKLY